LVACSGEGTVKRREVIALLGGAAAWPLAAHAQRSNNIPRLCFLTLDPGTLQTTRFGAFFQALRELGHVNGKTITIDYLSADGRSERFAALTAECLRLKADIIAVSTTPAAQAAKEATRTVPIVMLQLGDPVGTGLVESLDRPGGNVTGMSQMSSDIAAKRLELLKEAVPGISRVLVLSYPADPIAPLQVRVLKEAARSLGVMLQIQNIGAVDDLPAAFDAGARERADGLLTTVGSIFVAYRAQVTELAARYRLPAMYTNLIQVTDAGGLMAYEPNISDLFRQAATYVDRILKGANPSDLPVQQATKFTLVVNLEAAREIGLTLTESILRRADELIQ
jgi:putative tryptophan/tyrosine transport system substrate-binding protein